VSILSLLTASGKNPSCRDEGVRVTCGAQGSPCNGSLGDSFYDSREEFTFCNVGLVCNSTSMMCVVEEAVVNSEVGDKCGSDSDCWSDDGVEWQCKKRKCIWTVRIATMPGKRRIGDDCLLNKDCYGNLTCSESECMGAGHKELCHGDWDCNSGVCDQYKCVDKLKAGAMCDQDRNCASADCSSNGTCGRLHIFDKSNGENCTDDFECSEDSYCWTNQSDATITECRRYELNDTLPCGNATWGSGAFCQTAGQVGSWSTLNARQSVCTCRNQNSDEPTCEEVSDCRAEWRAWVEAQVRATVECGEMPPNTTAFHEAAWEGDCYNSRVACSEYNLKECVDNNRESAFYHSMGMVGLNCLPVRALRQDVCRDFRELKAGAVSVQFSVIVSVLAVLAARLF
jgi:hypothetical protein